MLTVTLNLRISDEVPITRTTRNSAAKMRVVPGDAWTLFPKSHLTRIVLPGLPHLLAIRPELGPDLDPTID